MKRKFEFAATTKVKALFKEVDDILRCIAQLLKESETTTEEWPSYVVVSDESRVADFIYQEPELVAFRRCTGLPDAGKLDLICDLALALRSKREPRQV